MSPTSVSSSVMSSSGNEGNSSTNDNRANVSTHNISLLSNGGCGGEKSASVSDAISNISSPDYQDENDLLSTRDLSGAMVITEPSDSDSTLIVDQVKSISKQKEREFPYSPATQANDFTLIVREDDGLGPFSNETITPNHLKNQTGLRDLGSSVSVSEDDGSDDADSLHSFHYSPKAVDVPSAIRLAKRLYTLDGFKKSDVSRHLSKKCVHFILYSCF